jgi:hypothetical protein
MFQDQTLEVAQKCKLQRLLRSSTGSSVGLQSSIVYIRAQRDFAVLSYSISVMIFSVNSAINGRSVWLVSVKDVTWRSDRTGDSLAPVPMSSPYLTGVPPGSQNEHFLQAPPSIPAPHPATVSPHGQFPPSALAQAQRAPWGFTNPPSPGNPHQSYSGHEYPNQGYLNPSYPNQTYQNQGPLNQGYPNQIYPNQGYQGGYQQSMPQNTMGHPPA